MITLTLKEQPTIVPLEAETITPDAFAELDHAAIRAVPVMLGKRKCRLDDFFDVDGERSDQIELRGNAAKIKWLGRGMSRGLLSVTGNAGMHLGSGMKGGVIRVSGDAGDWVGAEMTGGQIHVQGNAGGQVGAAYRGSMAGMKDGAIVVGGNAGLEVGMRMKRGIIAIKGKARDFAGLQMKGGTLVLGGAEIRAGAWMIRGTIIALSPLRLLPTFNFACQDSPTFLRVYARRLSQLGVDLPMDGTYRRYRGDSAVPGKGEILVWER